MLSHLTNSLLEKFLHKKLQHVSGYSAGKQITIGSLQGCTLQLPHNEEASAFTLQYEVTFPQIAVSAAQLVLPRARIEWICGGTKISRTINIGHGTAITGFGNSLVSTIFDYSTPIIPADAVPYQVNQVCAVGVRPTVPQTPPTLITQTNTANTDGDVRGGSGFYNLAASPGTRLVIVPPTAGVESVYFNFGLDPTLATPPNVLATFLSGVGVGAALAEVFAPELTNRWIPLHSSCSSILLENFDAVGYTFSNLWGIQG